MKLFSWLHGMQRKEKSNTPKSGQPDFFKGFTSKNAAHGCKGEQTPKNLPEVGQANELEHMSPEDPFEDEFKMHREGISLVFSNERFGLLAIGTFGFNTFGGKPDQIIESLQDVKQLMGEQMENLRLIKMEQRLKETLGDSKLCNPDDGGRAVSCFCSKAQDEGSAINSTFKISNTLEGEVVEGNLSTIPSSLGKLAKVIGWQLGARKKVYPSVNTDSIVPQIEAQNVGEAPLFQSKKSLKEKLAKQCKVQLGSCFKGNFDMKEPNNGKIPKQLYVSEKERSSHWQKTVVAPSKVRAALSIQDTSGQLTKQHRSSTAYQNKEVTTSCKSKRVDGSVALLTSKDALQQQPLMAADLRDSLPLRYPGLMPKSEAVYENWIKTDSECEFMT